MEAKLQSFAEACHRILAEQPGIEGREKVRTLLEQALKDDAFVAPYLGDDMPPRKLLYEDPELGFCILAHRFSGGGNGAPPHDHGPSWAIYGQARGQTLMSDWTLIEPASEDKPGTVRLAKSYTLTAGMAHVYNEGDLHSPRFEAPSWLIRIEGRDMSKVHRLSYRAV
ncbi:MAG TPA: hypothetical protein VKV28_00440 [Candidatus Binataceae bacterium]|nr:hypothetical protein [Candidatus Binataceae bacterium]